MRKGILVASLIVLVAFCIVSCAQVPPTQPQASGGAQVQPSPGAPAASTAPQPVKGAKENIVKGVTAILTFEAPIPPGKPAGFKVDPATKKKIKQFTYDGLSCNFQVGGTSTSYNLIVDENGRFDVSNIDLWKPVAQVKKFDKISISMPKFAEIVLVNVPIDLEKPNNLGKLVLKHAK
jgi:hypothetical protein